MTENDVTIRNKRIKVFIPVVILIALAIGVLVFSGQMGSHEHSEDEQTISARPGETIPNLLFFDLDGKEVEFDQLGSKLVLINFWASWCQPCLVEMPSIQALKSQYSDQDLKVVAVNLDEDPHLQAKHILDAISWKLPVYYDQGQKLSELFDIQGIPVTLIIDKDRKVLLYEQGDHDWNSRSVHQKIKRWLEG